MSNRLTGRVQFCPNCRSGVTHLQRLTRLLQECLSACEVALNDDDASELHTTVRGIFWNVQSIEALYDGALPPARLKLAPLPNVRGLPAVEQIRVLLDEALTEARAFLHQHEAQEWCEFGTDTQGLAFTLPLLLAALDEGQGATVLAGASR